MEMDQKNTRPEYRLKHGLYGLALSDLARGKFPDLEFVSMALRGGMPVPIEVRNFLADYIEGKIKKPRGRRPKRTTIDSLIKDMRLSMAAEAVEEYAKEEGISKEAAREFIARKNNLGEETLRKEEKHLRKKKNLG